MIMMMINYLKDHFITLTSSGENRNSQGSSKAAQNDYSMNIDKHCHKMSTAFGRLASLKSNCRKLCPAVTATETVRLGQESISLLSTNHRVTILRRRRW